VHDCIGAVEYFADATGRVDIGEVQCVPSHVLVDPGWFGRPAHDTDQFVSRFRVFEPAQECRADVSGGTGNDYLHGHTSPSRWEVRCGLFFVGSWPQFMSEYRHAVSRTSPDGCCAK
jgi:hypothetical protein